MQKGSFFIVLVFALFCASPGIAQDEDEPVGEEVQPVSQQIGEPTEVVPVELADDQADNAAPIETPTPAAEARQLEWLFCTWSKIPTVTVAAPDGDLRIPLVDQAVEFWNRQLEDLGSAFRLGQVTHTVNLVPTNYLRRLSEQPALRRERAPASPELARISGDLVIALSDGDFGSFTACARPGGPIVIGIRTDRVPPLAIPNVAQNVIAHELGHAIGLMHNDDPSQLMCGRPAACRPDAFRSAIPRFFLLTEQERARLLEFYPANWRPSY